MYIHVSRCMFQKAALHESQRELQEVVAQEVKFLKSVLATECNM